MDMVVTPGRAGFTPSWGYPSAEVWHSDHGRCSIKLALPYELLGDLFFFPSVVHTRVIDKPTFLHMTIFCVSCPQHYQACPLVACPFCHLHCAGTCVHAPWPYRQHIPNCVLRSRYLLSGICSHYCHRATRSSLLSCPSCGEHTNRRG